MRIITGIARGTKLKTLPGEHTRPTTEKVKEAVFSAIQFELHDRVTLDLFGGSGQMALEALSRGAAKAYIVENDRNATAVIKENAAKAKLMEKCVILNADWKDFVKHTKEKFSLVYLDPPYKEGFLDEVLALIFERGILAENAIVICESDAAGLPVPPEGVENRVYRYGKTYVTIFRF
ncbi:MAG: 16S rRNA (guanine(966)-N(2))-methyltransferase RsmD [Clostridia bacterium]|nr:16S rRNA (guanine(966)-N(2))-methyltransferase RsmD [Clostridia bacterium]MBQ6182688.1 16S rRNA (guanine(966)-N(2))-methyltransferase RsmD [Clostridia bacterium]